MANYNFHLPLPKALYKILREEAERTKTPATKIAREAIENWLEERKKTILHEQIASYAKNRAGSPHDLDEELETASVEFMIESEKKPK